MHDLPSLRKSFSEMGKEGWKQLVKDDQTAHEPDPIMMEAWRIYVREYGIYDEQDATGIPRQAAKEYLEAFKADRVPQWVLDMALTGDIRKAAESR